ncbi:fasciclin domain-containing protein [soil metagenome]
MQTSNRRKLAALVFPFALIVAACGTDDNGAAEDTTDPVETTAPAGGEEMTEEEMSEEEMSEEMSEEMAEPATAGEPEGPVCAAVPEDSSDPGSFEGMAEEPVATAASNNPELSTLVEAVGAADLVDTLNGEEALTVFAPINSAFEEIPEEDLTAVLEDTELLTSILTLHVVGERIEPEDLGGSYETLNGEEITIDGEAPEFDVNGQATVGCAGVQTSNATVYLIDSVLMPEG